MKPKFISIVLQLKYKSNKPMRLVSKAFFSCSPTNSENLFFKQSNIENSDSFIGDHYQNNVSKAKSYSKTIRAEAAHLKYKQKLLTSNTSRSCLPQIQAEAAHLNKLTRI